MRTLIWSLGDTVQILKFPRFVESSLLDPSLFSLQDIWTTQPIAALLMFGFPLLVFSFIIYMLCIADPGPEEEDMDETELGDDEISEEEQEQKEVKEVEADTGAKPKSD